MTDSARAMSKEDALAELRLDGWDPFAQQKQNGNVAGVVIRARDAVRPGGARQPHPHADRRDGNGVRGSHELPR